VRSRRGKDQKIGEVGVDSGTLLVSDPAHMFSEVSEKWEDWDAFLEDVDSVKEPVQLKYEKGHDGLGVVLPTGGDGAFDVFLREDGKHRELVVKLAREAREGQAVASGRETSEGMAVRVARQSMARLDYPVAPSEAPLFARALQKSSGIHKDEWQSGGIMGYGVAAYAPWIEERRAVSALRRIQAWLRRNRFVPIDRANDIWGQRVRPDSDEIGCRIRFYLQPRRDPFVNVWIFGGWSPMQTKLPRGAKELMPRMRRRREKKRMEGLRDRALVEASVVARTTYRKLERTVPGSKNEWRVTYPSGQQKWTNDVPGDGRNPNREREMADLMRRPDVRRVVGMVEDAVTNFLDNGDKGVLEDAATKARIHVGLEPALHVVRRVQDLAHEELKSLKSEGSMVRQKRAMEAVGTILDDLNREADPMNKKNAQQRQSRIALRVAAWHAGRLDTPEAMVAAEVLAAEVKRVEKPSSSHRNWKIVYDDGTVKYVKEEPKGLGKGKGDKGKVVQDKKKREKQGPKKAWKPKNQVTIPSREALHKILSDGHYTIISAGPNNKDPKEEKMSPDDPMFAKRHEALMRDLDKMGVPFTPTVGHYDGLENSFLVLHDGRDLPAKAHKSLMVQHEKKPSEAVEEKLNELGTKYNQNSVLHGGKGGQRMRFTTGPCAGKHCKGEGWNEAPEADDFFTEMELDKDNTSKFQLDIKQCIDEGWFDKC